MSERDVSGLSFGGLRERVIDEGIEAVRRDYTRADQKEKLEGSVAGFEGCRGLDQNELADLLTTARGWANKRALRAYDDAEAGRSYWWHRCFELEVEWVCNVLSAALMNSGLPTIVPPTARGAMKAAQILGVADR